MSDYIKREDAIKVIAEQSMFESSSEYDCDLDICKWEYWAEGLLSDIPSADVVERKRGEWVPATRQDEYAPERIKRHKCSNCGEKAKTIIVETKLIGNYYCPKAEPITVYEHEEQLSDFCPNCGADMRTDEHTMEEFMQGDLGNPEDGSL